MLIEIRDGEWINLQDVKSVSVSRAKVLDTGESKWHVMFETRNFLAESKLFDTRQEATAFAADIVNKLNQENLHD